MWGPQGKPRALDRIPEMRWSYGTLGLKQAHQHVLFLLPLLHPSKTNDIKHSSLPSTGILIAHPSEEPLAMSAKQTKVQPLIFTVPSSW